MDWDAVFDVVTRHCLGKSGADYFATTQIESARELRGRCISRLCWAKFARHIASSELASLKDARSKVQAAVVAVNHISFRHLPKLRLTAESQAGRDRDTLLLRELESGAAPEELNFDVLKPAPPEDYVDRAAISHMQMLLKALDAEISELAKAPQKGRGRRSNRPAHEVAYQALLFYQELSGQRATFWNEGSTPFSRFVEELYRTLGIVADLRSPIEAALDRRELDEKK